MCEIHHADYRNLLPCRFDRRHFHRHRHRNQLLQHQAICPPDLRQLSPAFNILVEAARNGSFTNLEKIGRSIDIPELAREIN